MTAGLSERIHVLTKRRLSYIVALCLGLIASVIIVWPVWPGFMSFDSLYVYRESIEGVAIAQQPPIHAYLFAFFRTIGLGAGGLFFFQTALLFCGSALIIRRFVDSTIVLVVAFALYVGGFYYFPTLLGTVIVQWKDVLTATFFIFGAALFLEANERRSYVLLALAVFSFSCAAAARLNAITLSIVPLVAMVVYPFGTWKASLRTRGTMLAIVLVSLLGINAQDRWRLPDFAPLPPEYGLGILMSWDLLGVSACEGVDLLPPEFGPQLSSDQLRSLYDYRLPDYSVMIRPGMPNPAGGYYAVHAPEIERQWRAVIPTHLGCYASHRISVFRTLLGLVNEPILDPTTTGIDPNPFNLHTERPAEADAIEHYVMQGAATMWRRPFFLYLLAPVLAVLVVQRLGRRYAPLLLLALSAYGYIIGLLFGAPSAPGRYPFASNVLCLLVTVICACVLAAWYVRTSRSSARSGG